MPTAILRPNADTMSMDFLPDAGSVHFDRVNDAVTQPATPSTGSGYLTMQSGVPRLEVLDMETVGGIHFATEVKVWVYSSFTMAGPTFNGSLVIGGETLPSVSFGAAAAAGWYSATFTGSWKQAAIDAMQVRLTFSSGSPVGTLYAMYAEVTYSLRRTHESQPPASVFRR